MKSKKPSLLSKMWLGGKGESSTGGVNDKEILFADLYQVTNIIDTVDTVKILQICFLGGQESCAKRPTFI